MYDRFTSAPYTRKDNDFNCLRYVAGSISDPKNLDKKWTGDNLYGSSAFVAPQPVYTVEELEKKFAELRAQVLDLRSHKKDWRRTVGSMPDDELTREAERLGREYRKHSRQAFQL